VSGVFRTINLPPPLHSASVSSPRTKGRGSTHSPGSEGVGGSIFRKTPDIVLASYSIISVLIELSGTQRETTEATLQLSSAETRIETFPYNDNVRIFANLQSTHDKVHLLIKPVTSYDLHFLDPKHIS
jgi:hypothetical protein